MFEVLMYLFENYIHSDAGLFIEPKELTDELLRAGFNQAEIFKALDWLEQLAELQHSDTSPYLITDSPQTMRIFTDHECKMLDVQCRNFLMFVERIGVTNGITREMVMDRLAALDKSFIGLDDLKWVVLMVLFNIPGAEVACEQMEDLIFDQPGDLLH
ncbi:MAG: DUF494 family protein [Pseudoalteromonas nigrifaciens]|uniref:DUF494 family protein n=1 Tax=Pseudoalteromonas nigrifaciens TaxID=28109 RepID=UPI003C71861B